ncbi:MAG: TlyA family RNA methyltransferase [Alphaproteobacteria bacterium]|nr:TlyA family RNA methyltransferase [Alphaproteobacteria bacterium]
MRLDQELVVRNIYPSRAKAVAAIKSGLVMVNGVVAQKPSQTISEMDEIFGGALPYASGRGSLKLLHALEYFNINPNGMMCLDVGASTGGFTEVLLSHGASRVIAVDVGTGQLIPQLRNDTRVLSCENTDIRKMQPIDGVGLIVVDVSFISLTNIADSLAAWGVLQMVVLVKPQFEVSREVAARTNGVIKSDELRQMAIDKVSKCFVDLGYNVVGVICSPILGGSGNTEYLMYLTKNK